MVTLANVQGSSLVPNLDTSLSTALQSFGTKRERDAEQRAIDEAERVRQAEADRQAAIEAQIQNLLPDPTADPSAKKSLEESALIRLGVLNPALAKQVSETIASGDEQQQEALRLEAEKGARNAALVSSQGSFAEKQAAITSLAQSAAARGEPLDRFIELQNMSEDQLDLELQRMNIAAQDIKTITTPTERFVAVTNEAGDVIGQRSTTTGKVVNDPRTVAATTPKTAIGQARADLKAGLITQADFDTLNQTDKKFQTDTGKALGDLNLAKQLFGEGSPQANAMQEVVDAVKVGEAPKLSDVAGVRKEFTKLSGDFIKLRDAIAKVEQSNLNPSPAGDLALIFNFMKIQDPGSVVRESEFETAQNATNLPGQLGAAANRVVSGERMLPAQRQDFVDTANRLFDAQKEKQRQLETSFTAIATSQNMKPEDVVIDFVGEIAGPGGTVMIGGQPTAVGTIITNSAGQQGRVESDGSITPIP